MKKSIFLATFLIGINFSQAQAGLFEYYLGQEVKTNASKEESVDAVETSSYSHPNAVDLYPSRTYYGDTFYSHNNSYYNTSYSYYSDCRDWTLWKVRPDCTNYIGYNNGYGDFYRKNDLLDMYEREKEKVEDEIDAIEDVISDIKKEIRELKRYTSPYYHNLREQLEDDLEYFEERKDDLEDMLHEIEDEIRDIRNSSGSYRNYYFNYYIPTSSYYRWSYYPEYYYYHALPINEELEEVKDGRIYIR